MYRQKSFFILSTLVITVAVFSMSLRKKLPNREAAVASVAALYQAEMIRFDSALTAYPKYFVDSSYEVRKLKYGQLAYQFKKIECLFTYFHPKLSSETFLKIPAFQKRDFGPPFPDNWLFIGPFGIDPDSVMVKTKKQDSAFTTKFIERAVENFKKVIEESKYAIEVEQMTEAQIFDALRLQMMRISTIGIANGDFVIEEAGMPSLEGAFDSWTVMVSTFATQLSPSQSILKNAISKKIKEGKTLLVKRTDFKTFNRMHFLTEVLIPLSGYLRQLQKALRIKTLNTFSALYPSATNLYEANAFNADYFAPRITNEPLPSSTEKFYNKEESLQHQSKTMDLSHHPHAHHPRKFTDYLFEFLMLFLAVFTVPTDSILLMKPP